MRSLFFVYLCVVTLFGYGQLQKSRTIRLEKNYKDGSIKKYLYDVTFKSRSSEITWLFDQEGDTTEIIISYPNILDNDSVIIFIEEGDTSMTQWSYDASGRLILEVDHDKGEKDTTKYFYDDFNKLIREDYVFSFAKLTDSIFYKDNLIVKTHRYTDGEHWFIELFNYDENRRLVLKVLLEKDSTLRNKHFFKYDNEGREIYSEVKNYDNDSLKFRIETRSYKKKGRVESIVVRRETGTEKTINYRNKKDRIIKKEYFSDQQQVKIIDRYLYD